MLVHEILWADSPSAADAQFMKPLAVLLSHIPYHLHYMISFASTLTLAETTQTLQGTTHTSLTHQGLPGSVTASPKVRLLMFMCVAL